MIVIGTGHRRVWMIWSREEWFVRCEHGCRSCWREGIQTGLGTLRVTASADENMQGSGNKVKTHPESRKEFSAICSFLEVALPRHSFARWPEHGRTFDTARAVSWIPNTSRSERSSFCAVVLRRRVSLSRAEPTDMSVIFVARGRKRPERPFKVRSVLLRCGRGESLPAARSPRDAAIQSRRLRGER